MAFRQSIEQTLSGAERSQLVAKAELQRFFQLLQGFLAELDDSQDEEHNKRIVGKFLEDVFYRNTNAINAANPIDLAIFADAVAKDSHLVVMLEVKKADNPEMVRPDDLNRKALHELILYYVRQEVGLHNTDIKHLIITDGRQWFFFDKRTFYDCFVARKTFAQKVLKADVEKNKTSYIYEQIIRPYVEELGSQLRYTCLSLEEVAAVNPDMVGRSRKVTNAYKLLSPQHMLKQTVLFDRNELSSAFYHELLYIMGLEEVMVDNIARIKRCKPKNRQPHSLIEETIALLNEKQTIQDEDETVEVALGLVLTWVNRLLFLKLLEAQLLSFDGYSGRKFLTPERVPDFYVLNDLFLQVLARPVEERMTELSDRFEDVPYLNSSLFDYTPAENEHLRVRELRNGRLKVYHSTRLHDQSRRRSREALPILEYLLRFLDAYDFSGNPLPDTDEDSDEAKTIINAAVLGIIFEKINGYKDGAFFTPSSLSEYMCREVIRRAVVDKFNEVYAPRGTHFRDFEALVDFLPVDAPSRKEANDIINSTHICDPSVGSGHFLVSALNELILIKHKIGCLEYVDSHNKVKEFDITIQDDELVVKIKGEGLFTYLRDGSGYDFQKTLFEEKRTIIENCLFGVDINPKSVEICRLRLWIELLKNAYYEDGRLQTLPNIDINIKCGNSLLSKYPVRVGEGVLNPDKPELLEEYRHLVCQYKGCKDKKLKAKLNRDLQQLTSGEMVLDAVHRSLFQPLVTAPMLATTMDWMLAFPEVLDEQGRFTGFDVVLGNPPYINMQSLPEMSEVYARLDVRVAATEKAVAVKGGRKKRHSAPLYRTYSSTGDICTLFFERGMQILKPNGYLCFITTNKWMRADYGADTRDFLTEQTNPILLVDFPGQKLFASATVETCILLLSRNENQHQLQACTTIKRKKGLYDYVHAHLTPCLFTGKEDWVIRNEMDVEIQKKVKDKANLLGTLGMQMNFGIKTGRNDVFIVPQTKRDEILGHCQTVEERQRTGALFHPLVKGRDLKRYKIDFADRWLIHTHNGIKIDDEVIVPHVDINDYPALKAYLDEHWDEIKNRSDKGRTPYNLRNCVYWPEFEKPKIIWGEISDVPKFCLDESGHYYPEATTFVMTGEHLIYLLVYLNSPLSAYLFSKLGTTTGAGTIRWKKYKVEQQLVPIVSPEDERRITDLYRAYQQTGNDVHLQQAYLVIYNAVGLTDEEISYIDSM